MARKASKGKYGTILEYLIWRGDLTFVQDPWNDIDSLIAAEASYSNFGENRLVFDNPHRLTFGDLATSDVLIRYPQTGLPFAMKYRNRLMEMLPLSRRFRDIRILDQVSDVDSTRNIQFSAMTLKVPDTGTVVCFRGTDPTIVGWKEDFMMSYVSPVPAQTAAAVYLKSVASKTEGALYVTGHSKGGNLAVYAAACAGPEVLKRLKAVYSFDGPGLDDETMASDGYQQIQPLIHSVIPYGSVVGLLMSYHQEYRVTESTASSLFQHEPGTWKLMGNRFVEREHVSLSAQVIDQTLHEWLKTCSKEQREIFTGVLFSLFEKKQQDKTMQAAEAMDESSRQMVRDLMHRLMIIGAVNSYSLWIRKPLAQAAQELQLRMKGSADERFRSATVQIDNRGDGFADAIHEAEKTAQVLDLSRKDALRLRLFTEEMINMIRTVAGKVNGDFWIEKAKNQLEVNLTTRTVLDRKARETLIASSTSRKNEAARSFLGRLRNAFELAMASDAENVIIDQYSSTAPGEKKSPEWDRYEQSVLLRLADNVLIAIQGGLVHLTVTKELTEATERIQS